MSYETILYEKRDGVATITLNRPEALNAFTAQMNRELLDALKDGSRDKAVRCFVLTGAGDRAFCAGQDLKERSPDRKGSLGESLRSRYNPIILAIRRTEKIVLCAVNGVAAGAGCNLTLACDLRIASENARFIEAFVRVGLGPDCGGSYFMPRLIGLSKAHRALPAGRAPERAGRPPLRPGGQGGSGGGAGNGDTGHGRKACPGPPQRRPDQADSQPFHVRRASGATSSTKPAPRKSPAAPPITTRGSGPSRKNARRCSKGSSPGERGLSRGNRQWSTRTGSG